MFMGFVLSESLLNPTLLNGLANIYVHIEGHPETPDIPFWHLYKIKINDEEIIQTIEKVSKEIKSNWYAHFWNKEMVYIIFLGKIFKIPREIKWSSEEFQLVKKYAIEHGINERYLDFWIEE